MEQQVSGSQMTQSTLGELVLLEEVSLKASFKDRDSADRIEFSKSSTMRDHTGEESGLNHLWHRVITDGEAVYKYIEIFSVLGRRAGSEQRFMGKKHWGKWEVCSGVPVNL